MASQGYNLRGAGGVSTNGDSPIGYYLDDVPFIVTNFGIAPPVRFIDIQRVEVLRGPQGTLYGQGSSGGVFIFHTRDPDLDHVQYAAEAMGSQTTGAGSLSYGVSGVVSVPVIKDVLAIRVSGGHSYNPGWADVYFGPYDGTPDKKGVNVMRNDDIRVVALFKPFDRLTIRAQYWRFLPRQQFTGFLSSVDPAYFENTAGQPSFANGEFNLWSVSGVLDLDHVTITSATSNLTGGFGINIPISPAGFFSSQFFPKMFAQELRMNSKGDGPLHWVVGGAYQDGQGPQSNQLSIPPFVFINADNNTLTENYAGFGEVSYDLFGGKLVPLVGLREYYDRRTFADSTSSLPTTKTVTTWRANLSYLPSDDLTMFVTAATGFRPGIVQSQVQVQSLQMNGIPAGVALNPETSLNYEFGMRWRTPDRSLAIDLNLYLTKFTDMQTSATGAISGVNGFANFGDATSKGVDYEIHWRTPVDGLTLSLVGNNNNSKFDRVVAAIQAAQPGSKPGSRLVNSILYNYRIDASYNKRLSDKVEGFGNISYSKTGNRFQGSGVYAQPYDTINATLGVHYGAYEIALTGDNLTDERGPTIIFGAPTAGAGITPRTIGLRFRINSQ